MLTMLLVGMLTLTFNIQQAESSEPRTTEWTRTYGGAKNDYAWSVVETGDGGYALAGYTKSFGAGDYDFWLVKVNSSGDVQWNKTYGGASDDRARSVLETSDGGYALAGYTTSFETGSTDFWLVKVDSSGKMQWNKTYGGQWNDWAYSVVETGDGGYALAGDTDSFGAGLRDFWLVKVDSSGKMQWNKTYGGQWNDEAWSVVETSDEGYALAGYTTSYGAGSTDFWLVKVDSSGKMQWNKTYGGTDYDFAWSVVETSDEGYALTGYTTSYGAGDYNFWLVKTDASGNMEWNKTYGGTDDDKAFSVVETGDGGYALAGYTKSFGAGDYDFWLVKVDSSGDVQWNKRYGGAGSDEARSVVETSDEGYALAGYTTSFGAGLRDFWLVKVGRARHDVAVTNVTPSKTVVGQGYSTSIYVTVDNQGYYTENFNVTVYADQNASIIGDETTIGTQNVTLASENSTTLPITWNTTGVPYGNYTISAYAWPVPGETDTDDNTFIDDTVRVNMVGDLAPEFGIVNIVDIVYVAIHFGAERGETEYEPNADINSDGIINIVDMVIVGVHFGETYP